MSYFPVRNQEVSPADSGEKYRIVLPVVLPDNQAAAGTVLYRKKAAFSPHNKWTAILLFGAFCYQLLYH